MIDLDTAPPQSRTGRARRPLTPLLLLGLALAVLVGPAVPPSRTRAAVIIPATFRDDTFVDGDRLFVVGPTGLLRIFRLPDARPLGQMPIGYLGSVSGVRQVGDVLLVTAGGPRVTVALDATSGRRLWTAGADVVMVSGGLVVLTDDLAIWAVDPHLGTVAWRVEQPTVGSRFLVTAGLDRMVSYDGETGAVVATQKISLSGIIYSYVSPRRFVIGDSSGLSGYLLPSLARQWHVDTDPQEDRLQLDCVRVLCSYLGEQGVTVRDPATGRPLWSSPRWATLEPLGPDLLAAADHGPFDAVRLYLLDSATGRVLTDFGGWRAITTTGGGPRYALHATTASNDYLFGELDPAHTTVRVLGVAPQISGRTDVSAGALIYHRPDGAITVWRFG